MFPRKNNNIIKQLKNAIESNLNNDPDITKAKKVLKLSGIDSELSETFMSRPVDKINLPEVVEGKAEFVYNYFTPDERVREPNDQILNLNVSSKEDVFYAKNNKRIPRYVRLSFKTPKINNDLLESNLSNELIEKINDNLDKIIVEGAMSNKVYTGLELLDTGKETNLYTMGRGILFANNLMQGKDSQKDSVDKLYDTLEEKGGLFGDDKKILIEALTNVKAEGYRISKADITDTVAHFLDDPISKQTFSIQFNNLLMTDIIENSLIVPDNTFQDELRSLKDISKDIKKEIIASIPPANTFREADYDLQVSAIDLTYFNNDNASDIERFASNYPKIKFVGYLIEKFEVSPDEETIFLGRKFIPGGRSNFAIDTDIKYGAAYFYKIRSICIVETVLSVINTLDKSLNQLAIAKVTMASEGKLIPVTCFEYIPPPPPTMIKCSFDFDTLLPRIYWDFPVNKQRDIKKFQIFKRFNIEQPFTLIAEFDFDNSIIKSNFPEKALNKNLYKFDSAKTYFIDTSHKEGEEPIYTICSVDAHGMSSNYGPQFKVKRDKFTNKVTTTRISQSGAPKPYPNMFVNEDAFIDVIKTSNYDRINIFLDPDCFRLTKYKDKNRVNTNDTNGSITEEDLNHLAIDDAKARYTMQIINIDNQKDKIIKIKLQNKAITVVDEDYFNISETGISEKNLSFQYGME